ncbi:hypothetical protein EZS27_032150, partial [termite gut metagenome]
FPSSDETEIKMLFQMQENVGIIILTFNALQKWHVIYLKLAMPYFKYLYAKSSSISLKTPVKKVFVLNA